MATDLTPAADERAQPSDTPLVRAPRQPRAAVYTGRFGFAYALLAALVGLAVGGFIVLIGRSSDETKWSYWQPSTVATAPREIAEYVSARYRLPSGSPLVGVSVFKPPIIQSVPVGYYIVRRSGVQEDAKGVPAGNESLMFSFCGFGARCAIAEGRPSVERARMMHQEAFELALYTFQYVDGVNSIVTLLPPRPGQQQATFALFFQKDDVREHLDRPLRATLQEGGVLRTDQFSSERAQRVGSMVARNLYRFSAQQAPDGSAVLILQQPAV